MYIYVNRLGDLPNGQCHLHLMTVIRYQKYVIHYNGTIERSGSSQNLNREMRSNMKLHLIYFRTRLYAEPAAPSRHEHAKCSSLHGSSVNNTPLITFRVKKHRIYAVKRYNGSYTQGSFYTTS